MPNRGLGLLVLITLANVAHADDRPPITAGRTAAEVGAGLVGGTAGFFAGALTGAGLECHGVCDGNQSGVGGAVIGALIGIPIGTALGVSAVGHTGDQTGSTFETIEYAFIGLGVGLGVGFFPEIIASQQRTGSRGEHIGEGIAITAVAAGPVVGAIVGFDRSRRYDVTPTVAVAHGGATLGIAGSF